MKWQRILIITNVVCVLIRPLHLLLLARQELYVTSTKKQKMKISRSIVEAIRDLDPPGRFLDKDSRTGLWKDIGDRKAVEKTSQALRDGAAEVRRQLSQDLSDPNFLMDVFDDAVDISLRKDESDSQTYSSGGSLGSVNSKTSKPKPIKAKDSYNKKKVHRRTTSNPNTLAERKVAMMTNQIATAAVTEEDDCLPRPVLSPMCSIGSLRNDDDDDDDEINYDHLEQQYHLHRHRHLHEKAASLDDAILDFPDDGPWEL